MDDLINAIEEAFGSLIGEYNIKVDETIESQNAFADLGYVEHDIVDTGRLLNSKIVNVDGSAGGFSADFSWDPQDPDTGARYANYVWAGHWARGGKTFVPGRHWPERAARDMHITQRFTELLQEQGLDATIIVNGDENIDA